jgi:methylated-DNA-protein-cysteine methyltransferase-like protein
VAPFSQRVYRTVRRIPAGKVIPYGGIAALLGMPRAARGVGQALSRLPEGMDVPWWRVVNGKGEISMHDQRALLQRSLLEVEGVRFGAGRRIDLKRYGWQP